MELADSAYRTDGEYLSCWSLLLKFNNFVVVIHDEKSASRVIL